MVVPRINRTGFLLMLLFLIGFFLRFYNIPQNLFFGPEQGIDFLAIKNIVVNHSPTLIGSKTDIGGIFHGPVYYYLAAIPFLLSHGSPIFVSLFFIFIHSLTVFVTYYLGKEMFGKRVGILAALLFTFAFGAIIYARWLSSPPLSIFFSGLYFLFLNRFLKGHKFSLIWASLVFCLLGEVEFLNFIFYSIITLLIIFFFHKEFIKHRLITLASLLVLVIGSISNYLLFDFRHNFLITKGITKLALGESGYYLSYVNSAKSGLSGLVGGFSYFVLPFQAIASLLLFIAGLVFLMKLLKENRVSATLLLLWLTVPALVIIVLRRDALEHFFVSMGIAFILVLAIFIDFVWKKNQLLGIILSFLIIGLNLYVWDISIPRNQNIFFQSPQLGLKFSDQLKTIDKIYQRASGKPFSFQSYTIPYWSQQGWEYLFWYYGKQKYGYEPLHRNTKTLYVIIQDDPSNKNFQRNWLDNTVSRWGKWNYEFKYGILKVTELKI